MKPRMVTNDERREVAARFRQITHTSSAESMICAYLDALGVPGYMDWVEIAESIADYIEPEPEAERTCTMKWRKPAVAGNYGYCACSFCGCGIEYGEEPFFCQNCGAKVVDDD